MSYGCSTGKETFFSHTTAQETKKGRITRRRLQKEQLPCLPRSLPDCFPRHGPLVFSITPPNTSCHSATGCHDPHFLEKWKSQFASELKQKERAWQGDRQQLEVLARWPGFVPKIQQAKMTWELSPTSTNMGGHVHLYSTHTQIK